MTLDHEYSARSHIQNEHRAFGLSTYVFLDPIYKKIVSINSKLTLLQRDTLLKYLVLVFLFESKEVA